MYIYIYIERERMPSASFLLVGRSAFCGPPRTPCTANSSSSGSSSSSSSGESSISSSSSSSSSTMIIIIDCLMKLIMVIFCGPPRTPCTANLPSKIIPAKIPWLKASGEFPAGMRIQPLRIRIMLESDPMKSRTLVRRLGAVESFQRAAHQVGPS